MGVDAYARTEWLAIGILTLARGGDRRLAYLGAFGLASVVIEWLSKNRSS